MRSYMAKPCDMYFTLEKKLKRFLSMSLGAFLVPEEERSQVVNYMTNVDIRSVADKVMQALFKKLAMKFEFELNINSFNKKEEV